MRNEPASRFLQPAWQADSRDRNDAGAQFGCVPFLQFVLARTISGMRNAYEESRIHSRQSNEGGRAMITTNEAEFLAQRSEWLELNRFRPKPGMFRSYKQAIAFLIFSMAMCGFLVWGGKALLGVIRH